mgnify:CR=1 FL=1
MTKKFDELNDAFNVSGDIVPTESTEVGITKPERHERNDIEKDYEYTRGNLYSIIEKGQEALDSALEIAVDQGQARAFEVVGQLIKSVADTTDKLMDLQKKIKEVEEDNSKGPTNVTNAMFFGSTAELSKLLKKNRTEKEDK